MLASSTSLLVVDRDDHLDHRAGKGKGRHGRWLLLGR